MILTVLGVLGGFAFAFAAVPQAVATWRAGKSLGTPPSIAWAIFVGCICLYAYLTGTHGFDLLLTLVYGVETISWATLLWFNYFPIGEVH